ncbi:DUF2612 domain-containing protein [Salmonella enterica]|uniref:DUF2612 domain-containing protein n=33 Tax=Salmonella enterica TaxID=28901 RepID=A0A5Z8EBX7_SALMU|nr:MULTISPECIES: DUF2612 domain-containing protein [Salmonella]EAA1090661.1 DUF2612 domain-containing protein [Salmonella enterica subsp. enterica serovar Durban]EAA3500273.1 DUF2612 domain-containing protein [Salmonella enterica subsp. enterica serovar Chester]EAA4436170.1 DUF2612 domain-containing protein [Salmonella enterica subsp. salamae]EAA6847042.1 DUF2612 domain-containing protein [Salmonella enterica subsp. enterica serovar Stanleyville]EAA7539815.1 DUF2612 domain-containing protein [
MQNVAATVLAQYAASPRLNALINSFNAALSPDSFINDFYDLIWNIDTAEKYGLDVWGKIVGVSRRLTVKDDFNYLGFSEARMDNPVMDDPRPFNQAPFYSGKAVTRTVDLSDEIYRRLILMKAMSNITDCSVPDINRMLRFMFGKNRRAYVLNNGGLRMSYIFEFALSSAELAIIQSSGALPSPPGVYVSVVLKETSNEA